MGHYYTTEGEPRHFVPMKTRPDELRPTRVTDAKKEGWLPSVTTIMNVLDKPALVNWKVDQHLCVAFGMDGPEKYDSREAYIREVKRETQIEMDKAPSAGTDIHNILEAHFRGEDYDPQYHEMCMAVEVVLPDTAWTPEQRFADQRGFAGMCDLSRPGWVIDFKTKQTADKFKPGKMVYPDHHRQLAAYREGLGMPDARCANLFICIETGEVDFHEHSEDDLQRGWRVFCHALEIWKESNYDSSFNQEDAA